MSQTLEYGRPDPLRWSRVFAFAALITLAYPLFFLLCFYGEYFLAWLMLGHAPRPSLDDPKDIGGSNWMHPIAGLALLGFFPVGLASLALNMLYIIYARLRGPRLGVQIGVLLVLWGGTWAMLLLDPMGVVYWWLD